MASRISTTTVAITPTAPAITASLPELGAGVSVVVGGGVGGLEDLVITGEVVVVLVIVSETVLCSITRLELLVCGSPTFVVCGCWTVVACGSWMMEVVG